MQRGASRFAYSAHNTQGAAILPSVPPVSGDMGMSLPALQPAAVAAAYQDSVLDQADGDEGGLLQAQTDATHGQAHGQQVTHVTYVVLMVKVFEVCPHFQV